MFLWAVGRRRGKNAFCIHHLINLVNIRDAAYGVLNSARSPGILEPSLDLHVEAGSALRLHRTLGSPRCTIFAVHACVRHVDGSTGRAGGKNGFGWRSEQQQPLQMQLFTLFSHSEEQRAGGCQQLSGTTRLPCSPAWPIQGLEQTGFHFTSTEHLYSDGKLCQQPVRRSWRKEGRQYPPLVTACEASLGDTAKSSTSSSAWMQQMGTN